MMVVAVMLVGHSAFGQVIRISKEASVAASQDVRLGDVATITGTDAKTAEQLANLVILPNLRESRNVRAESVLMAVIAQTGPGQLADRLNVTGAANCEVKIESPAAKAPVVEPKVVVRTDVAPVVVAVRGGAAVKSDTPVKEASSETLAKLISTKLAELLRVGEEDLRINFTSSHPLLDSPAPAGKAFVLKPLTRSFVGSVQFEVQYVEGSRILQRFNVQVQVFKRERVLIATSELSKGDVVLRSHFRIDDAWLDRQMPTLFNDEKKVVGMEAVRSVSAGSMLDQRDFRPMEMVGRGEAITVFFVQGNLRVQMDGVAMQSGKLHEAIQVKKNSTNETYQATLIGKRLAVVGSVSDQLEKQLREIR